MCSMRQRRSGPITAYGSAMSVWDASESDARTYADSSINASSFVVVFQLRMVMYL